MKAKPKTLEPGKSLPAEAEWYHAKGDQLQGPFTVSELIELIDSRHLDLTAFVWKQGFADWMRICDVEFFQEKFASSPKQDLLEAAKRLEEGRKREQRQTPRAPFEVRVLLTNGDDVGWGVCRDISLGGMQVLMNYVPGPVGTELRIHVNGYRGISGFDCSGKIVRAGNDKRSFSLEFTKLPDKAKESLARFIEERSANEK